MAFPLFLTEPPEESPITRALKSLQESIRPLAFALPPMPTFPTEPPVSSKALTSIFDAIQPPGESPFMRALKSLQEPVPLPAFTLPPMPSVASILDAIQPPVFTPPLMLTFPDDRQLTTTSCLVLPSEFRQPSTKTDRSLMFEVYDQIFEFENKLRRFIDEEMAQAYGSDWIKHRIPGTMRKEWEDRRDRALKAGMKPCPLIDYADFGDYEKIIIQRDNWETVFKAYFHRKEFVQESFQRIHPVRRSTMHCRIITIDDRLFLAVEVRRFIMSIGRKNSGMC